MAVDKRDLDIEGNIKKECNHSIYQQALLKANQLGFKVRFDTVPVAGEGLSFLVTQSSKTKSGSYRFVSKHYHPILGKRITLSKNIIEPISMQLPGHPQAQINLDTQGRFMLQGLETKAEIRIILNSDGEISQIKTTERIHVFCKKQFTLKENILANSGKWITADTIGLYIDAPLDPLNHSKGFSSNSLKLYMKEGLEFTAPIKLPGSLQFILRQGATKPIRILNDITLGTEETYQKNKKETEIIDSRKEANFIIDTEGQELLLMSEKELPEKPGFQHTPALILNSDKTFEFLLYHQGSVNRLIPSSGNAIWLKLYEFFEKHYFQKKVFLLKEHPILKFIIAFGKHRNKHLVPVVIGSEQKPYLKVAATGCIDIHTSNFDLVKAKVVASKGIFITSSGEIVTGRLKKLEKNTEIPCGLLSGAELSLEAEQSIISEGAEIYGKSGLRFVSPLEFDNISGEITTSGAALVDTPRFKHRILTGSKPAQTIQKTITREAYYSLGFDRHMHPVVSWSSDGKSVTVINMWIFPYDDAFAKTAYMRVEKTLKTTGKTAIIGSIIHHNGFPGSAPSMSNFVPRFHKDPRERRMATMRGGDSSIYSYGRPFIAKFSSASKELALSNTKFELTGIVFAPNISLSNVERGIIGFVTKNILLPPPPKFVPVTSLLDNFQPGPRLEYMGPKHETVYRNIFTAPNKISLLRTLLNADGSLTADTSGFGTILPAECEAELLVKKLIQDFGRGILSQETTEPEAIYRQLLNNAFILMKMGSAPKGFDNSGNPSWCAHLKDPILVYREMIFEDLPKLSPYVIFPPSWNNVKLRDYAGGLFALKNINIRGKSQTDSVLIITAHIEARDTLSIKNLKELSLEPNVHEVKKQVTDVIDQSSFFGLCQDSRVQTKTVTITTPNAGNTVTAEKIALENIGTASVKATHLKSGKGGVSTASVEKISVTPLVATSLRTHSASAENLWGGVSVVQNIVQHKIIPAKLNSEDGIKLQSGEQSHYSTEIKAKKDVELISDKNMKLGATKVKEDLPAAASSNTRCGAMAISLSMGTLEKGKPVSIISEEGNVSVSASTLHDVGTDIIAAEKVKLKSKSSIKREPLVLTVQKHTQTEGIAPFRIFEQTRKESHEICKPSVIVAKTIEMSVINGNLILIAPLLFAKEKLILRVPKGTVSIKAAKLNNDLTIDELSLGLSFFGSQAIEAALRNDFKEAGLSLLREFPIFASMESLLKSKDTADMVSSGVKTLYHAYKTYKAFTEAKTLKDFIKGQIQPNLKLRLGISNTERHWTEAALCWLQARQIHIKAKNVSGVGVMSSCEKLKIKAEENISFSAAEKQIRENSTSSGNSIGILPISVGIDMAASELKAQEYITSRFNMSKLSVFDAGENLSLRGVCVETLKATISAETLHLETLQDNLRSSNHSVDISTGGVSASLGHHNRQFAKDQAGIHAQEKLLVNVKKHIDLLGAKLSVGEKGSGLLTAKDIRGQTVVDREVSVQCGANTALNPLTTGSVIMGLASAEYRYSKKERENHAFVSAAITTQGIMSNTTRDPNQAQVETMNEKNHIAAAIPVINPSALPTAAKEIQHVLTTTPKMLQQKETAVLCSPEYAQYIYATNKSREASKKAKNLRRSPSNQSPSKPRIKKMSLLENSSKASTETNESTHQTVDLNELSYLYALDKTKSHPGNKAKNTSSSFLDWIIPAAEASGPDSDLDKNVNRTVENTKLKLKTYSCQDYVIAAAAGFYSAFGNYFQSILHPWDNIIVPSLELNQDAVFSLAGEIALDLTAKYPEMRKENGYDDLVYNLYPRAVINTNRRLDNIWALGSTFASASGPKKTETITEVATSILLPGFAMKGAKALNNFHYFRMYNPPKFHTIPDKGMQKGPVKKLSIQEARKYLDDVEPLIYTINEDYQIIITEHKYDHWHLGSFKPVYAAGEIFGKNGKITKITNKSGSYLPQGRHMKDLVEFSFVREGFPDAIHKFSEWFKEPGFKNTLRSSPKIEYPIITRENFKIPSLSGLAIGAAMSFKCIPTIIPQQKMDSEMGQSGILKFSGASCGKFLPLYNIRQIQEKQKTKSMASFFDYLISTAGASEREGYEEAGSNSITNNAEFNPARNSYWDYFKENSDNSRYNPFSSTLLAASAFNIYDAQLRNQARKEFKGLYGEYVTGKSFLEIDKQLQRSVNLSNMQISDAYREAVQKVREEALKQDNVAKSYEIVKSWFEDVSEIEKPKIEPLTREHCHQFANYYEDIWERLKDRSTPWGKHLSEFCQSNFQWPWNVKADNHKGNYEFIRYVANHISEATDISLSFIKSLRVSGAILGIAGIGLSMYNVDTAKDRAEAGIKEVAGFGGAILGGMGGGVLAGMACGPASPICSATGAFLGGMAGALTFSYGSTYGYRKISDLWNNSSIPETNHSHETGGETKTFLPQFKRVKIYDYANSLPLPSEIRNNDPYMEIIINEVKNMKSGDKLDLHTTSRGGDGKVSADLVEAIKGTKGRVTAVVDGLAASAAAEITVECQDVIFKPGSAILFHKSRPKSPLISGDVDGEHLNSVIHTVQKAKLSQYLTNNQLKEIFDNNKDLMINGEDMQKQLCEEVNKGCQHVTNVPF